VVVYLHSFLISTLDGVVSCSLLTAAALFPRDAAPDIPLIGSSEGHGARLDALDILRIFFLGMESNRATQITAYVKSPVSSLIEHQSCMEGTVRYKPGPNINVTNTLTPRNLSLLDVWHVVGRWWTSDLYIITDIHWIDPEYTL
jgi:hypothetical protein